jgi:hypothetical protein
VLFLSAASNQLYYRALLTGCEYYGGCKAIDKIVYNYLCDSYYLSDLREPSQALAIALARQRKQAFFPQHCWGTCG